MAQILSYFIQLAFGVPTFEAFSSVYFRSRQVMEAIRIQSNLNNLKINLADKKDIDRMEWLAENTNEEIMVSLFKLDRCINPFKGNFQVIDHKRRFLRNDSQERNEQEKNDFVELTELEMQYYCMKATEEITLIVVRTIMAYSDEYPMEMDSGEAFDIQKLMGIGGKENGKKTGK